MTDHVQRVIARATATQFVLQHGPALGDDPARLTDMFTEMLIRFEQQTSPYWLTFNRFVKLDIAFNAARWVLSDLLLGFALILHGTDRFKWHQRICQLILHYMAERTSKRPDCPGHASPATADTYPYSFTLN